MFGIHFARQSGKLIAVADIGSGSAGVAIVRVGNNGTATILASQRMSLPYEERTSAQTASGVLALLKDACDKVQKAYAVTSPKHSGSISAVHAIVRAPWASSRTGRAATSFKDEMHITADIVEKLAREALAAEKDIDKAKMFEGAVVSVELNGYPTAKPVKRHAHSVAVATVISECEPAIRAGVTETLSRAFSHSPVLHGEVRVLLSVLHEGTESRRNHVVIDMGSESSNCIVIRKDIAAEHVLLPEGTRTILKRIAEKGIPEETLALMRMHARDACSTPACDALSASLTRVESELVQIFGEAMGRLVASRRLPNTLSLIVDPDFAPWLLQFFSRVDFGQFTVTTQPFTPSVLGPDELKCFAVPQRGVVADTGLVLAASFINIEEA